MKRLFAEMGGSLSLSLLTSGQSTVSVMEFSLELARPPSYPHPVSQRKRGIKPGYRKETFKFPEFSYCMHQPKLSRGWIS